MDAVSKFVRPAMALAFLALVGPGFAQCPAGPPGVVPPAAGGSWSPVYRLPIPAGLNEITHSAVLPRATIGPNPTPHEGKVLFWCRRACTPTPTGPSLIFRWSPLTPSTIDATITVPNTLATDIWCGGHTFMANGDLFIDGGTDFVNGSCIGPYTGQNAAFRFSNATQTVTQLPSMARDHWYASVVELADGSEFVTGHYELESPNQSPPTPGQTYEIFRDVATPFWDPVQENTPQTSPPCLPATALSLDGYSRLHLLSSGMIMYSGPDQTARYFGPACGNNRWMPGATTALNADRFEGNSVHLIVE